MERLRALPVLGGGGFFAAGGTVGGLGCFGQPYVSPTPDLNPKCTRANVNTRYQELQPWQDDLITKAEVGPLAKLKAAAAAAAEA
jgi:hypothetical protein